MTKKVFTGKFNVLLVVLLLGGFLYAAFSQGYGLESSRGIEEYTAPKQENIITPKIQAAFKVGVTEINLSELTEFDWDRVCVFERPDASSEFYANTYALEYIEKNNIKGRMKISRAARKATMLMVFLRGGEIVHTYYNEKDTLLIQDNKVAFYSASRQNCISKSGAMLILKTGVTKKGRDYQLLRLEDRGAH